MQDAPFPLDLINPSFSQWHAIAATALAVSVTAMAKGD